jgi:hypothetical protein
MNDLYLHIASGSPKASGSRLLQGWRAQALGNALKALLAGEYQANLSWQSGHPVSQIGK